MSGIAVVAVLGLLAVLVHEVNTGYLAKLRRRFQRTRAIGRMRRRLWTGDGSVQEIYQEMQDTLDRLSQ